ncbi:hypothetical protein Tco_1291671 [Tanacetum coccineum]
MEIWCLGLMLKANLSLQLSSLMVNKGYGCTILLTDDVQNDGLFQVMNSIEAAEAYYYYNRHVDFSSFCDRLDRKREKSSDTKAQNSQPIGQWSDRDYQPQTNDKDYLGNFVNSSMPTHRLNEGLKMLPGGHAVTNNGATSTESFSPSRYQADGEYDSQLNVSAHGHGMVSISDVKNAVSPSNQNLRDKGNTKRYLRVIKDMYEGVKTRVRTTMGSTEFFQVEVSLHQGAINISVLIAESAEGLNNRIKKWREALEDNGLRVAIDTRDQEQEILLLRKHLADYTIKAFDQQQQDLVDAASKALSYRQDIIERK